MRYLALACDYDGTIASGGAVDEATVSALERVKDSGRHLLLVTGRQLDDLLRVFGRIGVFDKVVAENGALVYTPATREIQLIGEPPPPALIQALTKRGVAPLSVGRVIVATWEPHETVVLEVIRDLALEMQVIFNKGAVMVLPSGVNKAVGLQAAFDGLGLSAHNVVGIGDAENDHAFLAVCEASAAVANALPTLKERADLVTSADHGKGVQELIGMILDEDLASLATRLSRHDVRIGTTEDGREVCLPAHSHGLLLAGPSKSGKSTLATTFLERLAASNRQFCILDPEGDYATFEMAVSLGTEQRAASVDEVLEVMEKPGQNISINLIGVALKERPKFFQALLPRLQALRARTGRPHWLILDEAHHLMPAEWHATSTTEGLKNALMVTLTPDSLSPAALAGIERLIVVGDGADERIRNFFQATGRPAPSIGELDLDRGDAMLTGQDPREAPVRFHIDMPATERRRHRRKYAEGDLGPDRSFYFRGPDDLLRLRASNLEMFLDLSDGVDEATWLHHLRRHDYSNWFRENIKDPPLADEAARIEEREGLAAQESRARIRDAIEQRYMIRTASR